MICLQHIVLKLFSHNQDSYQRSQGHAEGDDDKNVFCWTDSAIILLDNTGNLLGNNINLLLGQPDFPGMWKGLLDYLRIFLERQSLVLSKVVYSTIEKILVEIEKSNHLKFSACTKVIWELWEEGNPSKHQSPEKRSSNNQAALSAYLHCLIALQPLLAASLTLDHLKTILVQLQICAIESSTTSYSDDTDSSTGVQAQIMEILHYLSDSIPGAISAIIISTAFFTSLPFERDPRGVLKGGPTFVAFSKAAMDFLGSFIFKHANEDTIYTDGSFLAALEALSLPISLKYKWRVESKLPSTWQKATTTAIDILGVTIPAQAGSEATIPENADIWSCILSISNNILSANEALVEKPTSENPEDQAFDIGSSQRLYSLMIPVLGSSSISDRLRRLFAKSIFENSLIHSPHPDDLPEPESREILANLTSVHIGRTNDLRPSRRSQMAYVCLDKLSDLVARHDGSSERVSLAQAAAPYLILRASIVLKAYVLDQPLRGHMPTPASQRKEILYILQKLVDLNSEPKAIPDAPGIRSDKKKHLYRIYALATKALKVCRRDIVVHDALMKVFEVCALDFGVD